MENPLLKEATIAIFTICGDEKSIKLKDLYQEHLMSIKISLALSQSVARKLKAVCIFAICTMCGYEKSITF